MQNIFVQSFLKGLGKTVGVVFVAGLATLGFYIVNGTIEAAHAPVVLTRHDVDTPSVEMSDATSQTEDTVPGKWRTSFY
jgi:hypothetical protein